MPVSRNNRKKNKSQNKNKMKMTTTLKDQIFQQMKRLIAKVKTSNKEAVIVDFAPYRLVYDFHPALLEACSSRDNYLANMTITFYVMMGDISVCDINYYLKRFGISRAEYNAMLAEGAAGIYDVAA